MDELDRVVRPGFLRRGLDLLHGQVRGLAAGRTEVGQVSGERQQVADNQVQRLLAAAATAVVAACSKPDGGREDEARDQQWHRFLNQDPSYEVSTGHLS